MSRWGNDSSSETDCTWAAHPVNLLKAAGRHFNKAGRTVCDLGLKLSGCKSTAGAKLVTKGSCDHTVHTALFHGGDHG